MADKTTRTTERIGTLLSGIALLFLEVDAGRRPHRQLIRYLDERAMAYGGLALRLQEAPRRRGSVKPNVLRVRWCTWDDRIEAAAVVRNVDGSLGALVMQVRLYPHGPRIEDVQHVG